MVDFLDLRIQVFWPERAVCLSLRGIGLMVSGQGSGLDITLDNGLVFEIWGGPLTRTRMSETTVTTSTR